jgi:hypothetical protein
MSTTVNITNGIDVDQLVATIGAIQADADIAAFTFRAHSTWQAGTPQRRRDRVLHPRRAGGRQPNRAVPPHR